MRNMYLYGFGLAILVLNKIRHAFTGYKNPREFSMRDIDRAVAYDKDILSRWLGHLDRYTNGTVTIEDKILLELGPGDDLGVALLALASGAKRYFSLDKHALAAASPQTFYDTLLQDIRKNLSTHTSIIQKLEETHALPLQAQSEQDFPIQYRCDGDFDPRVFPPHSVDIIFSQAAFEHFDNVRELFSRLENVTRSGTVLIAEVDLKTHTRFIRDRDPLNIYRYGDWLYGALKFSGSPNRLRPFEYKNILEESGWTDIEIFPLKTLLQADLKQTASSLAKKFRHEKNEMEILEFMLCAKKK